jgi:tetratricopeptide (TPR) repeat protein
MTSIMQCHLKTLVLLAVLIGVTGCADSNRSASPELFKDQRPAEKDRWFRASEFANSNIREAKDPKILPETHFAAGRLFESQGLFGKAIDQYRRAIAVNHHFAEAYDRLGPLLSASGLRDEALAALRKAVELRPKNATYRNNLGFELLLANRWAEAEYELTQAIRIRPDFPRAYINLGIAQSKVGKFNNALASFRRVLPEADAYYNVGLMYRSQNRIDEAAGAFRRAIAIDERFVAAKTQLDELGATTQRSASREPVRRVAREGVAGQEAVPATFGVTKKSDTRPSKRITRNRSHGHGDIESQERSTATEGSWGDTLARLDRSMRRPSQPAPRVGSEIEAQGRTRRAIEPSGSAGDAVVSILENEFNCVEAQFLDETGDVMFVDVGIERGYSSPADPSTIAGAMAMTRSRHDRVDYEAYESFAQFDESAEWCPADIRPTEVSWIDENESWFMSSQAVSSADPLALLRELEFQLGVLRNEFDCRNGDEMVSSRNPEVTTRFEGTLAQPGKDRGTLMGPPSLAAPMGRETSGRTSEGKSPMDVRAIVDLLNQHSTKTPSATEGGDPRDARTKKDDSRKPRGKKVSERMIDSGWMFDQVEGLFGLTKDEYMRWQDACAMGVPVLGPLQSQQVAGHVPGWPFMAVDADARADLSGSADYVNDSDADMP